jgi:capsular polysaccharide biosynthesis protein
VRPNIPVVLLIGFILSIGAGVGVASLREYADHSAHTILDLARAANLPALAGIPVIVSRDDVIREKERRKKRLIAACIILVIGLLIIHFFIIDIDIIWAKISRRLS